MGLGAYLKTIKKLRKYVRKNDISLIHAHYSLSGYVAGLSTRKTVICSLMGSDIQVRGIKKMIVRAFCKYRWSAVIVKSQSMANRLGFQNAQIIPNGVNLKVFKEINRADAREKTGFDESCKWVLFLANPDRPEKNFTLAKSAIQKLNDSHIRLEVVHNVDHKLIPYYLSAADVIILTSKWEGSPNVIKEAMACNCPIVSTDVGDVKEVIRDTEGCYITSFKPEDVAEKLKMALDFGQRTNGREKIRHLDDKIIAERLIEVYKSVLNNG